MYVIKRSGKTELIKYDKITERNLKIAKELYGSNIPIDLTKLSQLIIQGLKSGMTTTEIDELSSETATHMSTYQPEYDKLASAIAISNLHKSTEDSFLKTMRKLYNYTSEDGRKYGLISDEMFKFMTKNKEEIEKTIDYKRDFNYTYFGFKTLEKSYLLKIDNKVVERPQHMLMRCAIGIHGPSKKYKYEGNIQKVIETYNEISNGKFTHASPTLYNACSIRPQMSSCFLLHMDDDLNHMYQTALRSALISKYAGGIGIDISNIRCKGSKVHSTNGNSNGIIPMIKVFNQVALHCDQSGKRKGSIAMYLQPWHPDVLDFLQLRFNSPPEELRARDIFIAMWIPDIFMRRVERDEMWTLICPSKCKELTNTYGEEFDKIYEECEQKGIFNKQIKARVIWDSILRSQEETGLPYMLYKDSVNNKNNQKNIGLIRSSNLCVSGETKILTKKYGWKEIKELEDTYNELWNGYEWSNSLVKKTSESSKLLNISFSDGTEIKCTKYHKFIIPKGARKEKTIKIDANELKEGDIIAKIPDLPVLEFENNDFKYPYTSGFYTGDGTYTDNKNKKRCSYKKKYGSFCGRHKDWYPEYLSKYDDDICEVEERIISSICLYKEKQNLLDKLEYIGEPTINSDKTIIRLPHDIAKKYTIPINQTLKIRLEWLAGLIDSDGCLSYNSIQIGSIHKQFLYDIKLMCQTMGVNPIINLSKKEKNILMPDNKGGKKEYFCKDLYRLIFNCSDTLKLLNLGLKTYRINIDPEKIPNRDCRHYIKVNSIVELEKEEPTWCFGEPLKNQGMFNGILAGNCTEILEYTDKDSIAVCNLASIALPKYIYEDENKELKFDYKELGRITEMITENLNLIIDKNFYPVPEAEHNNLSYRPIGIGIQGLADVFAMLNYTWDSKEAKELNQKIFEYIYYHAVKKSNELAIKDGSYSAFKGSPISQGILQYHMWNKRPLSEELNWKELEKNVKNGMRNSLLVAPMPTASTAQILNNNEAFEPFTSNIYSRSVLAGDFVCVNKHLYKKLKEINLWNKSLVDKIIANNGSIQKIDEIPKHIKDIYKTVWEIPQRILIDMAADRGAFIDQSQSLNIFIDHPTHAKLSSMHFYGWKKGLKTGSYYIRSKPSREAIKFTIDNKVLDNKTTIKNSDEGECLMCSS